MSRPFVNLHIHSHYSLLEALPKIDDLVAAAKADGQTALALTDLGNLYGAIEFYKECKKAEIKPIIGVDCFLAPRTRKEKEHRTDEPTAKITLLAKNETGYRNLLELVTASYLEGFFERPRIDRELLERYRAGLIAILPALSGEHVSALGSTTEERARETFAWYQRLFGTDLFVEISYFDDIEGHNERMKRIREIARAMDIPCVAARESYYLSHDDAVARELVNKIRTGGALNRDQEEQLHDFSFLTQAAANKAFRQDPELLDATVAIAEQCTVELKLGSWVFPAFEIPEGTTHDSQLRELAFGGFARRGLSQTPEVLERVEYELSVIAKKGYSPYFLVVSDLLRHAKENGILTNIRGSVAGSLVTYLSGITNVNPLEYNLPFERFLNPERPSAPDIDMDYADNRRDEMIDYVRAKYGDDHVAQIGTFGTMLARAAVRDVSRALGHSYGVGDRIAKLIPFPKQGFPVFIGSSIDNVPELGEVYKQDAEAQEILDLAQKVEGNARHVGVHAAGVVIAPTVVTDFVPIQLDPKGGKKITQYDMHAVEDAGLLKFDFLGLTNLSVLSDAIARVKARLGIEIDVDQIPLDDQKTFSMLARGETLGVFQLAGGGMTAYLVDLKPSVIHDINAMVALYRPGPMAFIPQYIERKHNPALVHYLDPRMEPILKTSYGVIAYQDDVLQIAINLAGYSWLEADKFRKAMGKKIPAEMAAQKEKFQSGCLERGMKPEVVQKLWEQIETFAAYGFNKAHAASYGNLAYKTAYMKANYPVDYMAAVLTADAGDVEKIAEIVAECKRMGITILPPSVNESFGNFTVVEATATVGFGGVSQSDGSRGSAGAAAPDSDPQNQQSSGAEAIRFGMYSIKNFGTSIGDSIAHERENGRFTDLSDFLSRITDKNLNKKSLESLIKCGAMDSFGERGLLLANIDALLQTHKEYTKAPSAQDSLFGALTFAKPSLALIPAPEAPMDQKLEWEKELLGLYVSGHPLDKHRAKLSNQKTTIKHAKENLKGFETVLGGFIETMQVILTKKGERMAFLKVADLTDSLEVVLFPRTLKEYESIIKPGTCALFKGRISDRNGEPSFVADKAKAL